MIRSWPWILPILWMALLFHLSSLSVVRLPIPYFPGVDKVAHAGVYFLLVLSFYPWLGRGQSPRGWLPFAGAAALTFSVTDEFHQTLVPGRSLEILDLLADLIGVLLASALVMLLWRWRHGCRMISCREQ